MLNVNSSGNRFSDLACTSRIDISVVLSFLWRSIEDAVSTTPCNIPSITSISLHPLLWISENCTVLIINK